MHDAYRRDHRSQRSRIPTRRGTETTVLGGPTDAASEELLELEELVCPEELLLELEEELLLELEELVCPDELLLGLEEELLLDQLDVTR